MSGQPQVPTGHPSVAGSHIRLGDGFAAVSATRSGSTWTTTVDISRAVGAKKIWLGHTLPRGSQVAKVVLDGHVVKHWTSRTTNRGLEVTVPTRSGAHTLVVTTR